jgi:hypothetical protein
MKIKVCREFKEALLNGSFDNKTDGPFTLFMDTRRGWKDGVDARFVLRDRMGRCFTEVEVSFTPGDSVTLIDVGRMLNISIVYA